MVICGEIEYSGDRQDIVTNPRFIAEILSKSTADYDRGGKFVHYRSIPGLADYMIAAQDSSPRRTLYTPARRLVAAQGVYLAHRCRTDRVDRR